MIVEVKIFNKVNIECIEKTLHLIAFFNFGDITEMISEEVISKNLQVIDIYKMETVLTNLCGYKVELVSPKMENITERDLWYISKTFTRLFENKFNKKYSVDSVATLLKNKNLTVPYLKKLEFRIVVPYKYKQVVANIESFFFDKPISFTDWKKEKISLPVLINVGDYGINVKLEPSHSDSNYPLVPVEEIKILLAERELNKKNKHSKCKGGQSHD